MRITAENVGARMVVRHVVGGRGPSGGPAMTDVVGRILAVDDAVVTVERRDGTVATIALATVVTAKVVPAVPTRSRGAMAISSDNLRRIMARGGADPDRSAVVQVAMLRHSYDSAGVRIAERPDAGWLALHTAVGAGEALAPAPTVGFASIGDPVVAIGRVVITGEWAGLSCVAVAPSSRRQRLGTRIVEALISWARQHGADKAYLQLEAEQAAAADLFAPFGFRPHP